MKNKLLIAISVLALTIALSAGISYAWFTAQDTADVTSVEAGYVNISLTGNPDEADKIFPADDGKSVDYTITNLSNNEVVVRFKLGGLAAYVMPEAYLDEGFIIKDEHDYHGLMKGLKPDAKMNINGESSDFVKLDKIPAADLTSTFNDSWVLTGVGCRFLGLDEEGNQYFLIPEDGKAEGRLSIALSPEAGNRYQYALFTLGEATALATQNNASAIAAAFDGIDLDDLDDLILP